MPIPATRLELVELVTGSFHKLLAELDAAGDRAGDVACVEDWTVKDLLAVRTWWTERVVEWIEEGREGGSPTLPAEGYGWSETPRLNDDVVSASRSEPYERVLERLEKGFERVLEVIDELDDHQLLEVGAFGWAGKWPVSRWISINTARQYATARTYVRKAMKTSRQGGE